MSLPKVEGCRWDGDHEEVIDREGLARLSEGFCCDCQVRSERDGEWTICPCCRIGWRIESGYLVARFALEPSPLFARVKVPHEFSGHAQEACENDSGGLLDYTNCGPLSARNPK